MIVQPTPADHVAAKRFAMRRLRDDPGLGRFARQQDDANRYEGAYVGRLAEAVVARLFGVQVRETVFDGDDGGYDLQVGEYRVEVKSSRYATGSLLFMPTRTRMRPTADVFVLVVPADADRDYRRLRVLWTSRATFEAEHTEEDRGRGLRWWLSQDRMVAGALPALVEKACA